MLEEGDAISASLFLWLTFGVVAVAEAGGGHSLADASLGYELGFGAVYHGSEHAVELGY